MENTEEYYRLITEHTTDMISKHDAHGIFIFASPACVRLIGYTPDELIGLNSYDLFHPDDLPAIQKSHQTILKTPFIYTVAYRIKHKNGYYVWVEATSKTIRDPKTGEILEIIASTRDITERKKAENALNRRYAFERKIGEISTEFISLGTEQIDKGIHRALATIGTLSHADRAYIFLYHEDGLLADNTHEWCAQGIKPHIDHLKNINISADLPYFSACIHTRAIFSVPDVSAMPSEGNKEKTHFEQQGIQSLIVVPMTFGDRLLGFIGFDAVSEKHQWTEEDKAVLRWVGELFSSAIVRKHMEKKLRESETRWQFALEGAGDGLWDWNAVTNHVYFSKQWKAMLGYAEDEIANNLDEWKRRIHPDDLDQVITDLERYFSGMTEIYRNEHRVRCKDGSYKWILDRGKIISWTKDGKPLRVIGTHADISARKKSDAEREKLIAELKDLLKKVKTLSGLLPICSFCKKIRDDKGYWRQLETYIQDHSEAEFSHSLCVECARKHYPDFKV